MGKLLLSLEQMVMGAYIYDSVQPSRRRERERGRDGYLAAVQ